MKTVLPLLLILAFLPARPALACDHDDGYSLHVTCFDSPARWAPRHDLRHARLAITTDDRDVTLLVTNEVVAMQLSNRAFHKVEREVHEERNADEEGESVIGRAIKNAVLSGVLSLLDHSREYSLRDLYDVQYRDGGLVFISRDGHVDETFSIDNDDDDQPLRRFSEHDAKVFVREFHRAKARIG